MSLLKALLRMNVLNGVFFSATSCKNNTENGAAVTSLRTIVFRYDFTIFNETDVRTEC